MSVIDPIFLDGADDHRPPPPGTVGSMLSVDCPPLGPDWLSALAGRVERFRPHPRARLIGLRGGDVDDQAAGRPTVDGPESVAATLTGRHFDAESGEVTLDQQLRGDGAYGPARVELSWRLPAAGQPEPDPSTDEIGSPAWGALLAASLAADPEFASSTATLDGSIGIVSRTPAGPSAVEFRIYRGKIIEHGRKSLDGATFAIEADALTWAELVTGRYDDYVRFAARGRFTIRGSGFHYLRLNRTVRIMVHHARAMRQDAVRKADQARG
jgi:hypothetical protein